MAKWECSRCKVKIETGGNEPAYCECCGNTEFTIEKNDEKET